MNAQPARARVPFAAILATAAALQGCRTPFDPVRAQRPQLDTPRAELSWLEPNADSAPAAKGPAPIELDESATLADYLAYGAANNPALRAAFYRWRAAVERIPQAAALPDPMASYGYFLEDFSGRRGMEQHIFELEQAFPWFGKLRLREDAATLAANAAAQDYEAQRLATFLDIRRAYYELFQLGREISLTRDEVQLLQQFDAILRARFRAGEAAHADLARAQVELGRLEDRARQLEQLKAPATARLNAALNRPPSAPIAPPTDIPAERLNTDAPDLLAILQQANPRLRALQLDVERERTQAQLAELDYYPDVTLGGMYAVRGEAPLRVGIGVNIPLWRDKYDAAVREANARRLAAAYARHDESNRLGAELAEALYEHDDAQRRIELYRQTLLPKAEESLRASLTAFQAGTITLLELLDAERTLLEFRLAESRALTDRAIALARLDAMIGAPVPRTDERQAPAPAQPVAEIQLPKEPQP